MSERMILRGHIRKESKGWASDNWERMTKAHPGELDGFVKGTFNVSLDQPWIAPCHEMLARRARDSAINRRVHGETDEDGLDFLEKGNYIHPNVAITAINDQPIFAKSYIPAGMHNNFIPYSAIELIATSRIRNVLQVAPDAISAIELTIEVHDHLPSPGLARFLSERFSGSQLALREVLSQVSSDGFEWSGFDKSRISTDLTIAMCHRSERITVCELIPEIAN